MGLFCWWVFKGVPIFDPLEGMLYQSQHSFMVVNSLSICTVNVVVNNTNPIHVPVIYSSSFFDWGPGARTPAWGPQNVVLVTAVFWWWGNFLLSVIRVSFSSFCISHPSVIGAESTSNPSFSPTLALSFSHHIVTFVVPSILVNFWWSFLYLSGKKFCSHMHLWRGGCRI